MAATAALAIVFLVCATSAVALTITNVTPVNVTSAGFSVIFQASETSTPGILVYADANGQTNLADQVGVEPLPLHTGNPAVSEAYDRRQNQLAIRRKTGNAGLGHVRVSNCQPGTTYYYRVQATDTNGLPTVWPNAGPLPSVTTAVETSFVVESRQFVVDIPGADAEGRIVTLTHANAAYALAVVAGDGVGTNQAFFNLGDLLALAGGTNFVPVGSQQFEAQLFGQPGSSSRYTLSFSSQFTVASASSFSLGTNQASGALMVSLGSTVLRAGANGSVPIALTASEGVASLNFSFDVPTGRLTNLAVQALTAAIQTPTIAQLSATRWQVTITAQPGQSITGTQQVARIDFAAVANQTSAFVPLQLVAVDGRHQNNSPFAAQFAESGRVTVVGQEPLLEALLEAGGSRTLVLYGVPGASYMIQSAGSLGGAGGWADWLGVTLTNLSHVISNVTPPSSIAFFRAYEVQQPRLEILVGPPPILFLHGRVGASYQVQFASSLSGAWVNWARVPMVAPTQVVPGTIPFSGGFFRAYEFTADPPLIDAFLDGGNTGSLVLYGQSGASYQLQYTTNLSGVVAWQTQLNYTLTGSFRQVSGITTTNPVVIYRISRP